MRQNDGGAMSEMIQLTIDDTAAAAEPGTTILQAAQQVGIEIPTICYHKNCTANALCRICAVEVEGARTLAPACTTPVSQGMVVHTQTERARRARRTILELMASSVDLSMAPDIQALIREYGAQVERFPGAETRSPEILDDNPMFIRDYARCILCWRCVQVCAQDEQYTFAINLTGRGYETQIGTFYNKPLLETACVFCGQCVGICPTGALRPKREFLLELGYTPQEIMNLTRSERKRRTRRESVPETGGAE
jgi:NADH dehydrogenase/NADH:ubiquinone oxidoreductase subunit G